MCCPTSWRVVSTGRAGPGWVALGPVPPVAAALATVVTARNSAAASASGRRATVTEARNTWRGVSMRASGVLPAAERRGHDARRLELDRVAGARDDQRPRPRHARDHPLGQLGVRAVALAGNRGDGHVQVAEARPQGPSRALAQTSKRGREPGGVVAQAVLVGGCRHVRWLPLEDRLPAPAAREGLDAQAGLQ